LCGGFGLLAVFSSTYSFNQDVSNWDTSNVAQMGSMFLEAKAFNQDVSTWDVSKVTQMGRMFTSASSFTQIWCSTDWANKISGADFGGFNANGEPNGGTGKVICCATGKFYNPTAVGLDCKLCPIGQYNNLTHVTDQLPISCETCPRNTFAPIKGLPDCSDCEEDQYR